MPSKEEYKVQQTKSTKEENKVQTLTKKGIGNGTSDDQSRSDKLRVSVGKKSPGESGSSGLPGNFVKVPLNSRKLTEASLSWASLPSSLSKLGKVIQFTSTTYWIL